MLILGWIIMAETETNTERMILRCAIAIACCMGLFLASSAIWPDK